MDSDIVNSKLDFLNSIMENELTAKGYRDGDEPIEEENDPNVTADNETNLKNETNQQNKEQNENDDLYDQNNHSSLSEEASTSNDSMEPDENSSNLSFAENANQNINNNNNNENYPEQTADLTSVKPVEPIHHHQHKPTKKVKKSVAIKNNQHNSLKTFYTPNNKQLYFIQSQAFSQFETKLFDLVGFSQSSSFKLENIKQEEKFVLKKLQEFNGYENSNCVLTDTNVLSENLTGNVFRKLQLKAAESQPIKLKTSKSSTTTTKSIDNNKINESENNNRGKKLNSKIITIVLNQHNETGGYKRRACRLLLTKRNTFSMDTVLNEMSNLFKIESSSFKRIFNMNGNQIINVIDLIEQDLVFLIIGSEKVHIKDLELEPEEIEKFFVNELMKNYNTGKLEKMLDKKQENFATNKNITEKELLSSADEIISLMPDELLNNYEIGEEIGYGHYALVRVVKDINTGYEFALKIIDLKKCVGKESMIENELAILRKIKHPNIVKLVEEYKSDEYFYLIMEYLKGGDLLESLTAQEKYSEKEASSLVHCLASALAYLHKNKIVHRDIKLENILVNKNSEGNISAVKLGDFGLATKIENELLNQKCGSPVYVAPEVLMEQKYGFEVDVWSLGVILYILLVGFAPFQGETDEATFELIKKDDLQFLSPYWDSISEDAKDLIRKMLDRNQETRIKAQDVLNHRWIRGDEQTGEDNEAEDGEETEPKETNNIKNVKSSATLSNSSNKKQASEKKPTQKKVYKASNVLSVINILRINGYKSKKGISQARYLICI